MKLKSLTLVTTLALALQACSLAPVHERPALPVDAAWPAGEAYAAATSADVQADIDWRAFFKDPALRALIAASLENNRDLRVAMLNVDAFRAQYRIQRSELLPTLDASADGSRQRLPADLSPLGEAGINSQYTVGANVSYELDFFGRVRNLSRQALEQYLATREAQHSAAISLVASVADAYLGWQSDRALLDLTGKTLETYEQTASLVQSSHDAGVASALDVRQARTAVDEARAQLQRYRRQVANDENALRLLIGGALPPDLPPGLGLEVDALARVSVGLPSELLQRRPDIRAAEHQLIGANANIGAARAAFFPSISLTGSGGTASAAMSDLFDGGSGFWSFMPRISVPIFNAGRLSASLDHAEIQKDIRIAQYEQAIQTAFKEVSDGLAARGTYGLQLDAQRDLVENTEAYFTLAQQRYQEGVDSYLNVLDAQRLLFTSQQQLIKDQFAQLSSEVMLYKALGGGWEEDPDQVR